MQAVEGFLLLAAFGLAVHLAWDDAKTLSVWPERLAAFSLLAIMVGYCFGFSTYPLVAVVGGSVFLLVVLGLLPVADGLFLTAALYLLPSVKLAVAFLLVLSLVDTVNRLFYLKLFVDTPLIAESMLSLFAVSVLKLVGGGLVG